MEKSLSNVDGGGSDGTMFCDGPQSLGRLNDTRTPFLRWNEGAHVSWHDRVTVRDEERLTVSSSTGIGDPIKKNP